MKSVLDNCHESPLGERLCSHLSLFKVHFMGVAKWCLERGLEIKAQFFP